MRKAWIAAALLASGCVSVPRDAGMSEVQKRIGEQGLKIAWSPDQPIEPPDDAKLQPLLEGELTADRAVEIALAHNRDLLAAMEEMGVARADLIEASTIRNPVFDGEVRFPGRPFEIGITQTLIDLFRLRNRRALGQAGFDAARLRMAGAVIGFAGEVRADYYVLQAAQQALAQQSTMAEAAQASAELALRQHEAGNISDLDLENEQARYERAKLDLARVELDEIQARERLLADLGALDTLPLTLPPQAMPSAGVEGETERFSAELEASLAGRLDISLAQAEIESARRALPLASSGAYDELALGVHHEREPEGDGTTGPALALPIPIFDRGLAGRTRAAASLRRAEQRLHALTVTARSEARAAHERLLEARARADYLRTVVVPRRQRILDLTQLEYNAMLLGAFDLIRARQGLADALREQVMAVRDYWLASTGLETAMSGAAGFSIRPAGEQRNE
ncbi:MAG TPA: TolC family protein [Thermoanaerobaculia bacterium]|jgi:cobalt-zinc-cadmium efflux system outer membrane protein|nr:TolC family protein [Thermoanaerobaculia bacterium]